MTMKNKIAHRMRQIWASTQTALAGTDEASRRRTDSAGKQSGGVIKRAGDKLKAAFNR